MLWSALPIGKHHGKSLPQIVLEDPDYFFWAYEQKIFKCSHVSQSEEIYRKARKIKPPLINGELPKVEYLVHQPTGTSLGFKLIKTSEGGYETNDYSARQMSVIDLMMPRCLKCYDKLGYQIFLRSLKFHFFGSEDRKLTRQECEEFFSNDSHFLLSPDGLAA